MDEKPPIQALERAQGYLKLPNGRALTGQSHDYKRHGTTTLLRRSKWPPERSSRLNQNAGAASAFIHSQDCLVCQKTPLMRGFVESLLVGLLKNAPFQTSN